MSVCVSEQQIVTSDLDIWHAGSYQLKGQSSRSQWPSGNMPEFGVRGPRFASHHGQLFITTATVIYSLGHRLHTLTAVPRSTQPSTLCGTVK